MKKIIFNKIVLISSFCAVSLIVFLINLEGGARQRVRVSPYPNGKDFAFTITDDPDGTRVWKVKPIYELLSKIGLKTTIAVWVRDANHSDGIPDNLHASYDGDSCENKEYLKMIQGLQQKGFEIALHTVSSGNDTRDRTVQGYEQFKSYFGEYPKVNIMHSKNLENIYWGKKTVENRIMKFVIGISSRKARFPFSGEIVGSQYFWGDVCKDKTKYVRMWGTTDINTLKYNPSMPFHDPEKPYVNYWFSFSDGYDVEIFTKLISKNNIERLQKERGACIVYTHFSANFTKKIDQGQRVVNKDFASKMIDLAKNQEGWFVPVSVLLDRLLLMKNIAIAPFQSGIVVSNSNSMAVEKITLITNPRNKLYDNSEKQYISNEQGEIVLDKIDGNGSMALYFKKSKRYLKKGRLSRFENMNLVFRRMLVFIRHSVIRW